MTDLARSLNFYVDILGFGVAYGLLDEGFAFLAFGGAQLVLEQTDPLEHELFRGDKKKPLESRRAYLFS